MAIKIPIKHTVENGTGPSSAPDRGANGTRRDDIVGEADNETENENEDNENNENDEEEEEDDDDDEGPYTPFDPPCKRSWLGGWGCRFLENHRTDALHSATFLLCSVKVACCVRCLLSAGLCFENSKNVCGHFNALSSQGTWARVEVGAFSPNVFCGGSSFLSLSDVPRDLWF